MTSGVIYGAHSEAFQFKLELHITRFGFQTFAERNEDPSQDAATRSHGYQSWANGLRDPK